MTTKCERKDLDPNITLGLTPDEIIAVDAVELEAFESRSFALVNCAPSSPPGARKTESEDRSLDATAGGDAGAMATIEASAGG